MFEYGSKLATDVASIIQPACDKRDLIDKDLYKMRKEVVSRELETIVPKIEMCFKHHTGLDIAIRNVPSIKNAFAIFKFNRNGTGKLNKYIDERLFQTNKMKPKMAEELIKLASKFEEDMINMSAIDEEIARCFEFTINCDFLSFLCAETEINLKISDFSAEEMTAILLHELGHILNSIKRMGMKKYAFEMQKKHFSYFAKNASSEEKLKLSKIIVKTMKKEKSQGEVVIVLDNITKEMGELFGDKKQGSDLRSGVIESSQLIFLFMCYVCMSKLLVYSLIFLENFLGVVRLKINDIYSDKDDFIYTNREFSFVERDADEFVAKHGYGHYLTSALSKVRKFPVFSDSSNSKSKFLYYVSSTVMFCTESFIHSYFLDLFDNAEPLYKRFEDIKLMTIKYLKNGSNGKEANLIYLDSLDRLEKDVKEMSNSFMFYRLMLKITRFLRNFRSLPALFENIYVGSLPSDMEDMIIELDRLQNNSLYVSSARLQTLLKD